MLVQLDLSVHTSFVRPAMQEAAQEAAVEDYHYQHYGGGRRALAPSAPTTAPSTLTLDMRSPTTFIGYCSVGGFVFTVWLAVIYWKVLQVQANCFKSDLMEFNVWEELKWMMQQQKMENQREAHRTKKEHLGKLGHCSPTPGNGSATSLIGGNRSYRTKAQRAKVQDNGGSHRRAMPSYTTCSNLRAIIGLAPSAASADAPSGSSPGGEGGLSEASRGGHLSGRARAVLAQPRCAGPNAAAAAAAAAAARTAPITRTCCWMRSPNGAPSRTGGSWSTCSGRGAARCSSRTPTAPTTTTAARATTTR